MPGGANEPKTSPRRLAVALRRIEAVKLRRDCKSYVEIAAILGYKTAHHALMDVQRHLAAEAREPTAEVRAMEVARIDEMWCAALEVLRREHLTVSHGKIIHLPDPDDPDGQGRPLLDDAPVLAAVDRLLKIQERRAKLLGLDAPTKVEVLTDDAIDDEIRRLTAELEQRAAAEAAASAGAED